MAFKTALYLPLTRSAMFRVSSKFSSNDTKIFEIDKKTSMKFNDASLVFGHKTTKELLRGFFVLHACSFDSLVNRSYDLMQGFERVFGSRLLRIAVAPFYNQFVAGNTEENISTVNETLASAGINLMIAPMLETDVGDLVNRRQLFANNYEKTSFLIEVSSRHRPKYGSRPICQTKLTAHLSADCLRRLSSKYESLSDEEKRIIVLEWSLAMKRLSKKNAAKIENFKCFGFAGQDLIEIKGALTHLYKIGKLCVDKDVILAVDAEYSFVNPAINLITLAMKSIFNKEKTVIWNTYQGYLKNSKYWLQHDLQLATSLGVKFGAKIVRGAYMEKERASAIMNNAPDPVHDSYEETNKSYNRLIDFIVPIVAAKSKGCHVMVATHNHNSIIHATEIMKNMGISPEGSSIVFAQIYGMAENISVTLAKHGYNVYKSVPFGSVTETLPYLARRANENRLVMQGARQEKTLLATELRNRLLLRNSRI